MSLQVLCCLSFMCVATAVVGVLVCLPLSSPLAVTNKYVYTKNGSQSVATRQAQTIAVLYTTIIAERNTNHQSPCGHCSENISAKPIPPRCGAKVGSGDSIGYRSTVVVLLL